MNENLNLVEILKNEPKGRILYSPLFGYIAFESITDSPDYPIGTIEYNGEYRNFSIDGKYFSEYKESECLLFPSKEQRDWSKFEPTKVDLPIDTPVMVKTKTGGSWKLKLYKGDRKCQGIDSCQFVHQYKAGDIIIPFDKFNPNDIEESLKYKLWIN